MNQPRSSTPEESGGKYSDPPVDDRPAARTIDAAELFDGDREVWIQHGQELYRLRLTRNGKLLLHK